MTYDICSVTDTLMKVSKDEFGSPKTLDFLAKHYRVDGLVDRTYHGALSMLSCLAFVYIEMTRKQEKFLIYNEQMDTSDQSGDASMRSED